MMIELLYEKYLNSNGISTDTRKIEPGSMFFALKGPNFNANQFAGEAIEKGAKYVVVDDTNYVKNDRYLLVDDTLIALQQLAGYHRKKLKLIVIGITGSNGKTTTKELIYAVLSKKYRTFATVGNLNNHIGVPLTILAIDDKIEIAIIEMGANKLGDIEELCQIAQPTCGLITNIGKAHTEGFGSFEGVIQGKSELYQYLLNNNGKVFVNSTNEILNEMVKDFERPYFYPDYSDYYHCELVASDPFLVIKSEKGNLIETNLVGRYNFENIAAALCIGKFFEVDNKKANKAISKYTPDNNRSQILKKGTNMVILDAYNANPVSMQAAIENISYMDSNQKVLILGDMNELGDISEAEHTNIAKVIREKSFFKVFFVGEKMQAAKSAYSKANYFQDVDALKDHLVSNPINNSLVLIKASRSLALERVLDNLES